MGKHLVWLGLSLVLVGCASSSMPWHKQAKEPPKPAVSETKKGEEDSHLSPYYTLNADANGPCIDIAITNRAEHDIAVSPKDFALIPRGERRPVVYDPEVATIDVPSVVHAGETIHGRAIFSEFKSPVGNKLVFNPRLDFVTGNSPTLAYIEPKGMGAPAEVAPPSLKEAEAAPVAASASKKLPSGLAAVPAAKKLVSAIPAPAAKKVASATPAPASKKVASSSTPAPASKKLTLGSAAGPAQKKAASMPVSNKLAADSAPTSASKPLKAAPARVSVFKKMGESFMPTSASKQLSSIPRIQTAVAH